MDFSQLNEIPNLQFIPIDERKVPLVTKWQNTIKQYDLTKCHSVGLVCGKSSEEDGHLLEVVDIDAKYDITGKLYERYKQLIHSVNKELLAKLVVQKTRNNGYHFIYRCEKVEGNLKLANRPATDEEKKITYKESYEKASLEGKTDEEARKIANKAKDNDKVRVLLETRGLGGYIACYPSIGYEIVHGDLYSIQNITIEERDTLHTIARQFNQVVQEDIPVFKKDFKKLSGLSPFDDYNNRGDIIGLLEANGWKKVKQQGNKTHFQRPGQTSALTSGNFDHDRNWFSVFTTSSEFEPTRAYLPYAVFTILECNNDYSAASRKLSEMGFGEKFEKKEEAKKDSPRVTKSKIDPNDNDFSFLATNTDYDGYLKHVIDDTLPIGLTTGSPTLDEHFLFKEGSLIMVNGHDNVGKTVFILWLFMLAALYHGWKFLIFSSENTLGSLVRKLIQFYWGKSLSPKIASEQMTKEQYVIAKEFVEKSFVFLKAQEDLYNYKDILNMTKKAMSKYPDLKYTFIDPYNSLKTDISSFSKLGVHDFNYEALSEIKAFIYKHNFGFYINNHAVTESLRKLDKDGYPIAPNKADTEGGGKSSNKADDFITLHRKTQHPTEWMITEVHVRKIKDTETGGKPTQLNSPVKFRLNQNGCGFTEYTEGLSTPIDPIREYHNTTKFIKNNSNFNGIIGNELEECPF